MVTFKNFVDVERICQLLGITKYTINSKGLVDVNGSVFLNNFKTNSKFMNYMKDNYRFTNLVQLPIKFGKVDGSFHCIQNELETLEGCPKIVGEGFYCGKNNLTTLKGGPQEVGSIFDCAYNHLSSLEHCPKFTEATIVEFDCSENCLKDLKGCPDKPYDRFNCSANEIETLEGGPQIVNDMYDCSHNNLTSLNGAPKETCDFDCSGNKLKSLHGGPKILTGHFYCNDNSLLTVAGGPDEVEYLYPYENPVEDIFIEFKKAVFGDEDYDDETEYGDDEGQSMKAYFIVKKAIDDFDFIRRNRVIKSRFKEALEDAATRYRGRNHVVTLPKSLHNYKLID